MQKTRKKLSIDWGLGLAYVAILLWWLTWAAPNIGLDGVSAMIKAVFTGQHAGLHLFIRTNPYTWLISIGYWAGFIALAWIIFVFSVMFVRDILKPNIIDIIDWVRSKKVRKTLTKDE